MKTNVALIGFMGSGKSAAGLMLAHKLDRSFIETDALIEERAGKSISAIFKQEGESHFRRLEHEVIAGAARRDNAVIACGGGAVLNPANIELLRRSSIIIYLEAAPSVIMRRLAAGGNKRPLLDVPDRAARVRSMLEERKPLYERAADIKINATHLSMEALAELIMRELSRYDSKDSQE